MFSLSQSQLCTLSLADVKQQYLGTHNRIALSEMRFLPKVN